MSGYIGSTPVPQATQHRESFTCTEGQTTFNTAGYTAQFVDVYLNGSHLSPADFTATNGSDVVLGVAASADDVCDIISYTPFEVAAQTFTGTTTMTDVVAATLDISGNIDIDGVTNLDVVDIDGAVDMASSLTVAGTLQIVDTELTESSDNFSINIQAGNNDFNVQSGGTTFAAFKGSAKDLQLTSGNLVIGTAGKGIDFTAQTPTGVTGATAGGSEILDHYEEGTWTPVVAGLTLSGVLANYTRIGDMVYYGLTVTMPATTATTHMKFTGLPFSVTNDVFGGSLIFTGGSVTAVQVLTTSAAELQLYKAAASFATYADFNGVIVRISGAYKTSAA